MRQALPGVSEKEYELHKERQFAGWLKFYVKNGYANEALPLWLHEMLEGPLNHINTAPMYFTRGFTFQTFSHCSTKATANYGVHVPGETDYYGVLQEIVEVTYPGCLNLKCVLLKCDWYDPTPTRRVRTNALGITEVNASRRFSKFEPYVLASQAEQVSFFTYPRLRERREKWLCVLKVNPRGRFTAEASDVALQHEISPRLISIPESTGDIFHISPMHPKVEDIQDDIEVNDEELDEFDESEEEENDEGECNDSE